jgi:hypothetical protein
MDPKANELFKTFWRKRWSDRRSVADIGSIDLTQTTIDSLEQLKVPGCWRCEKGIALQKVRRILAGNEPATHLIERKVHHIFEHRDVVDLTLMFDPKTFFELLRAEFSVESGVPLRKVTLVMVPASAEVENALKVSGLICSGAEMGAEGLVAVEGFSTLPTVKLYASAKRSVISYGKIGVYYKGQRLRGFRTRFEKVPGSSFVFLRFADDRAE